MRDAHAAFEEAGVRLYAISYDDAEALAAFARGQNIPFPLLSDVESEVIRRYGILNDQVDPGDAFLYGIPYPGSYVIDAGGIVVAKFFHDSYKKRDSPELLLDAARGRVVLSEQAPRAEGGEPDVQITAAMHGGAGSLRQGMRREIVIHFSLSGGLHLYGEPVPEGMVATSVDVQGPPGLVVESPILPPTHPLRLQSTGIDLAVWSGEFDIRFPVYATGELASEVRPLDQDRVTVKVTVRYQACDDQTCLLPRTERLQLDVPLDVVDVPRLGIHRGHGQREGSYDATPHMLRLLGRKIRRKPLGMLRFILRSIRLEWAARRRARGSRGA